MSEENWKERKEWTAEQLTEALSGRNTLQVAALLYLVDLGIEVAHMEAEKKGLGTIERSEACGGASYIRALKKEMKKWLAKSVDNPAHSS